MSILAADKREWAAIQLPFSTAITAFISAPKSAFGPTDPARNGPYGGSLRFPTISTTPR
jgi:hypothetical protein